MVGLVVGLVRVGVEMVRVVEEVERVEVVVEEVGQ